MITSKTLNKFKISDYQLFEYPQSILYYFRNQRYIPIRRYK